MEESKPDPRELMEQKASEKKALINSLREKNIQISKLEQELELAMPKNARAGPSPGKIQERLDKLEFQIATSAYTAALEKDLVKQVRILKKELDASTKDNKQWVEAKKIRDALRGARDERKGIRDKLDSLSKELDLLYNEIIAQGMKRAQDKKMREEKHEEYVERAKKREEKKKFNEERRKETAPYMKELDPFVSMEEIAEVKKKAPEQ